MSVYVVRYGDLLKIGYSSELAKRITLILWSIPGQSATFVGHMPGDREVEAHFHAMFETQRFSGEWFKSTPQMEAVFDAILIKELPAAEKVFSSRHASASAEVARYKGLLREYAAKAWPELNHRGRHEELAAALNWLPSRLVDLYRGAPRMVLRATEAAEIDALLARTPIHDETEDEK